MQQAEGPHSTGLKITFGRQTVIKVRKSQINTARTRAPADGWKHSHKFWTRLVRTVGEDSLFTLVITAFYFS